MSVRLLRRYADFRSRSGRRAFWTGAAFTLASWIVLSGVDRRVRPPSDAEAFGPAIGGVLSWTFAALAATPCLALAVRRLHDVDWRGWWLLLPPASGLGAFIVFVLLLATAGDSAEQAVWLVLLTPVLTGGWVVALFCRAGTSGPNRFGPDPDDPVGRIDLAEVFR